MRVAALAFRITGESVVKAQALMLVGASVAFHVTPLPDMVWEFVVKDEGTNWRLFPVNCRAVQLAADFTCFA